MNTVDVLTGARNFIQRGFCTGVWAKDRNGNSVLAHDRTATCWCVYGAIQAAIYEGLDCRKSDYERAVDEGRLLAVQALLKARNVDADGYYGAMHTVQRMSDEMTQKEALEWIDAAVESLKVAA